MGDKDEKTLKYKCSKCDKRFRYPSIAKTHYNAVHAERSYPCKQCAYTAPTHNNLRTHWAKEHPIVHNCEECGRPFKNKPMLTKHMALHEKGTPCSIKNCNIRVMPTRKRAHIRTHHPELLDNNNNLLNDQEILERVSPESKLPNTKDRSKSSSPSSNIQNSPDDLLNQCKCPHCGKVFPKSRYCTKHVQRVHEKKEAKRSVVTCPYDGCSRSFNNKTKFDAHINSHLGVKPFSCPVDNCDKAYHGRESLAEHVREYHGQRLKMFNIGAVMDCSKPINETNITGQPAF